MGKVSLTLGRSKQRQCGDCTKCCEGWLLADIAGEKLEPGKACSNVEVGVGCKVYKNRPAAICEDFSCYWKANEEVPEEFKPSVVNAIMHIQYIDEIPYLHITPASEDPSAMLVSWLVSHAMAKQINIHWTVGGKAFWVGHPDFTTAMVKRYFM